MRGEGGRGGREGGEREGGRGEEREGGERRETEGECKVLFLSQSTAKIFR